MGAARGAARTHAHTHTRARTRALTQDGQQVGAAGHGVHDGLVAVKRKEAALRGVKGGGGGEAARRCPTCGMRRCVDTRRESPQPFAPPHPATPQAWPHLQRRDAQRLRAGQQALEVGGTQGDRRGGCACAQGQVSRASEGPGGRLVARPEWRAGPQPQHTARRGLDVMPCHRATRAHRTRSTAAAWRSMGAQACRGCRLQRLHGGQAGVLSGCSGEWGACSTFA